jgi:hypothetical protein
MSNFECSVKDLMSNTEANNIPDVVPDNVNLEFNKSEENVSHPIEKPSDVNLSVYQRLYTDKNIKTVSFITLIYLALNSTQMNTFISNNAPFLLIEGSPGFLGKAVIGLILGIIIVVFTSFFSF